VRQYVITLSAISFRPWPGANSLQMGWKAGRSSQKRRSVSGVKASVNNRRILATSWDCEWVFSLASLSSSS